MARGRHRAAAFRSELLSSDFVPFRPDARPDPGRSPPSATRPAPPEGSTRPRGSIIAEGSQCEWRSPFNDLSYFRNSGSLRRVRSSAARPTIFDGAGMVGQEDCKVQLRPDIVSFSGATGFAGALKRPGTGKASGTQIGLPMAMAALQSSWMVGLARSTAPYICDRIAVREAPRRPIRRSFPRSSPSSAPGRCRGRGIGRASPGRGRRW